MGEVFTVSVGGVGDRRGSDRDQREWREERDGGQRAMEGKVRERMKGGRKKSIVKGGKRVEKIRRKGRKIRGSVRIEEGQEGQGQEGWKEEKVGRAQKEKMCLLSLEGRKSW